MSILKPVLGSQLQLGHPLANGLVGCWLMNEGGGNIIQDLSGNGLNGIMTNTTWDSGRFGNVCNFNGTTSIINCGRSPAVDNLPAMSISLWIYPRTRGEGGYGYLVDKSNDASGWRFRFGAMDNVNRVEFRADGSSDVRRYSHEYSFALNKWQQVVVTWDGSMSYSGIHLYVDGKELTYVIYSNGASRIDDSGNNITIGNVVDTSRTVDGLIDHVLLFDRVLTASEIMELYVNPFQMFEEEVSLPLISAAMQGGGLPLSIPVAIHHYEMAGGL